jgi:fatty acid desaturase
MAAAFMMAGMFHHWASYLLAGLVIGTRQHALAILGHEGAHRLVCRGRRLNDLITAFLCFSPLGLGLHAYRKHHFTHHRHPGTEVDPELAYKRSRSPQWDLPARKRLRWYFLKDILGLGVKDLVYVMLVVPPVCVWDVLGPLLWWSAAVTIVVLCGQMWMLALWFGSLITVFWTMFRLRVWTEHLGTADVHRVAAHWWQRLLFLPHNTWYHYEHHRWPSIPCWNLPAARALDQKVPVLSLSELFESYQTAAPISSGAPLAPLRPGS